MDPVEHAIYENVLLQLPYFATMLSDRWEQDGLEKLSFELPPLSNTDDFNILMQSLHRGTPFANTNNSDGAVGMFVLVKMLQAEQLMEIALQNIRDLTAADGIKLKDVLSTLDGYSSLEEVCRAPFFCSIPVCPPSSAGSRGDNGPTAFVSTQRMRYLHPKQLSSNTIRTSF